MSEDAQGKLHWYVMDQSQTLNCDRNSEGRRAKSPILVNCHVSIYVVLSLAKILLDTEGTFRPER